MEMCSTSAAGRGEGSPLCCVETVESCCTGVNGTVHRGFGRKGYTCRTRFSAKISCENGAVQRCSTSRWISSVITFLWMQEFLAKKWQNLRSIFLRTSVLWFLSPCHRKGRFWSGKRRIDVLIWGVAKLDTFTDVSNFERIAGLSYQVTMEPRGTRQRRVSLKCGRYREKNLTHKTFDHTFNRVGNRCYGYFSYNGLYRMQGYC